MYFTTLSLKELITWFVWIDDRYIGFKESWTVIIAACCVLEIKLAANISFSSTDKYLRKEPVCVLKRQSK